MRSSSGSTTPVVGVDRRSAGHRHGRVRVDPTGRFRTTAAIVAALFLIVGWVVVGGVAADAVVLPQSDLRLSGSVEERPDGGGIDSGDTMEYRITVRNEGPTTVPARGLLLVLFVDRADASDLATIEVASFNDGGGLRPAPGGACGNGRRTLVQCTNRQALETGDEITLQISHRHPVAEAGTLSFVAEASLAQPTISDPVPGNNSFRGPNYQFRDQPATTTSTTVTTTTTTMPTTMDPSTTTDPNASTTTMDPNASSTTMDPSSTTSSPSTTTSSSTTTTTTTTTTTSTTTTTAPTTTSTTTTTEPTTSLAALSGSATLPGGPTTVPAATETSAEQLVLSQSGSVPSDGGPPYLLLTALAALVLLIGGVGVALYAHLNQPPPLVDMRHVD